MLAVASPLYWNMVHLTAQAMGRTPHVDGALVSAVAFGLGLAFIGRAQCLATGVGNRLRAPLHLALHVLLLARLYGSTKDVCHAIAGREGGAWAVRTWHAALSHLLLPLPLPVAVVASIDTLGQCRGLLTAMRVFMGFVVPVVVNAAWEARELVAFCGREQARALGRRRPPRGCCGAVHRFYLTAWQAAPSLYGKLMGSMLVAGVVWFGAQVLAE